ncbi:DUF4340 domain-containing protein [Aphanothece sacrum]|uniref:DUF4340 domain-containing protein n=1 Tax=Aphanothece sacrum FPU1 TaxID=1920663 RepID=A0A401IDS5_APHSA|nr:DUF4340 domain-containing protein [Aphanothece sacrum]GBF79349.1 hypothetical protein AsFPU1_0742 [Aphanothece sacrum FPU1]GBF86851.1 hypothetical protein AsFPU3_3924 [Aphanothece sacrum FPU3]
MKLQKTTLGLFITAILFGGGVYIHEIQNESKQEETQSQEKKVFDFEEKDIKILTIETQGKTLKFEKTQNSQKPWQMKEPEDKVGNDAIISFLTNLLASEKIKRSFKVPTNQKKDYGLEKPLGIIKVELNDKTQHQLILGSPDFQGELIYAQVDPETQSQEQITISLVPKNFQYALERKPEEWLQLEPKPEPSNSK